MEIKCNMLLIQVCPICDLKVTCTKASFECSPRYLQVRESYCTANNNVICWQSPNRCDLRQYPQEEDKDIRIWVNNASRLEMVFRLKEEELLQAEALGDLVKIKKNFQQSYFMKDLQSRFICSMVRTASYRNASVTFKYRGIVSLFSQEDNTVSQVSSH